MSLHQTVRERMTRDAINKAEPSEIVDFIHDLEDQVEALEDRVERLEQENQRLEEIEEYRRSI